LNSNELQLFAIKPIRGVEKRPQLANWKDVIFHQDNAMFRLFADLTEINAT